MSHDLHTGSFLAFADQCLACETRTRRGLEALATVDESARQKIGRLAIDLNRGTPRRDASHHDMTVAWHLVEAAQAIHLCGLEVSDFMGPRPGADQCTCETLGYCQICHPARLREQGRVRA